MKILAVTAITLAFSCLLPFSQAQIDRYSMSIVEKGTSFSEQIDVDEKQNVEIFRVPAHNDVDGADFYHDFKMHVTVTRILSRKVCHISEMDSFISSPGKLKADLARAASQSGPLPVQVETSLVMVTGPANRLLLTKEILDFCGALPIYNTEHYIKSSNTNGTAIIRRRRQKRDTFFKNWKSCLKTVGRDVFEYVKAGGCHDQNINWDASCRMEHRYKECFYYVTCYPQTEVTLLRWNCTELHKSSESPICCDFICPT